MAKVTSCYHKDHTEQLAQSQLRGQEGHVSSIEGASRISGAPLGASAKIASSQV